MDYHTSPEEAGPLWLQEELWQKMKMRKGRSSRRAPLFVCVMGSAFVIK